jgi:hypothetical protein
MGSKWEHHYKKRIRSCNEVSIIKKSGRAMKVESLLPIPNGAQSKLKWSSELYLNSISCPTTTFRQPQAFPYSRPPAPPTTTPPPHNEAFLFVQCSLSPTSTLKSYTTTMSSTNLHNTKMVFLIVRSLRLYFYAIAAPAG